MKNTKYGAKRSFPPMKSRFDHGFEDNCLRYSLILYYFMQPITYKRVRQMPSFFFFFFKIDLTPVFNVHSFSILLWFYVDLRVKMMNNITRSLLVFYSIKSRFDHGIGGSLFSNILIYLIKFTVQNREKP